MANRGKNFTVGFVIASTFLLGGLMGWIGGSYITPIDRVNQARGNFIPGIGGGPEVSQEVVPYSTTVSDFRVQLNSLFKEHGVVTAEYLQNLHDGTDAGPLKNQLDQNSQLITTIIGKMYGNNAQQEFLSMWNEHITLYEAYVKSLKDKNLTAKNNAREELLSHAQKLGTSMEAIDRNFSKNRVEDLMKEHMRLTLDVIEAYAAKDNILLATSLKRSYDQAGVFADYFGQAIAASHPNILQ